MLFEGSVDRVYEEDCDSGVYNVVHDACVQRSDSFNVLLKRFRWMVENQSGAVAYVGRSSGKILRIIYILNAGSCSVLRLLTCWCEELIQCQPGLTLY